MDPVTRNRNSHGVIKHRIAIIGGLLYVILKKICVCFMPQIILVFTMDYILTILSDGAASNTASTCARVGVTKLNVS